MSNVSDTSKQAYLDLIPKLGRLQRQIYDFLQNQEHALTNTEISRHTGIAINVITPRILELRMKGLVYEATKRPCTMTGRTASAWRAQKEFI